MVLEGHIETQLPPHGRHLSKQTENSTSCHTQELRKKRRGSLSEPLAPLNSHLRAKALGIPMLQTAGPVPPRLGLGAERISSLALSSPRIRISEIMSGLK